jgi:DNA ligase D-like protein (predicted ligase)/DNA ligase D-like protein (predicted 3'-phosphoesterase)
MLAQSAEAPFSSKDWIFEIKWDGIRAISYINEEFSIRSRTQRELKYNFPELAELKKLAKDIVLDGEIIVLTEGQIDFQRLIERAQTNSAKTIKLLSKKFPATYVIFDILEKEGEPLLDLPLTERKKMLEEFVKEGKYVVLSIYVEEIGEAYYEAAIKRGMEGIIAKKKQSSYKPGRRSSDWLKIKKIKTCDCVIFGYTKGKKSRRETFGALILGLYSHATPLYVGKVGTGFSEAEMRKLIKVFEELQVKEGILSGADLPEDITWLKPELVCEVGYQSITREGKLRMPRFIRLRLDKMPRECTLDQIKPDTLQEYRSKSKFNKTSEPVGESRKQHNKYFVVHEHHARRLHYDLRLEKDGVLKSWAIPKGPPLETGDKRLAIETEDHPIEYSNFEGLIPEDEYGAGIVKIWDKGSYEELSWKENKIEFNVKGSKMRGLYVLLRFKKAGEKNWLLIKSKK